MQLAIIDFIKSHSNWEELLTQDPYNLTIKRDGKLILFKYSQIKSDFNEQICREARGLIVEDGTWKVVRMAFTKFFNIGESYAAKIDWDTAVATEKIDGSIISVFYYDGKWRIATNSTIDAFKAELNGVGLYKTFGELFESVLPLSTFANYNKHRCWTFELVSPYNKVVIDYPETKVYLLSVRDMDSLEELGLDAVEMIADANGIAAPERYDLNDEADYRQLVEQMPEGHEGIVVRDANGERVKIKTLLYFEMHKAKNNGVITLERIVDLIRANDHYEFLSYFPEYQPIFDKVKHQLDRVEVVKEKVQQDVAQWKRDNADVYEQDARMARKWFAQDLGKSKYGALYFAEYDGNFDEFVAGRTTSQFISLFKIELPKEDK
jgi:hypothetical protein